MKLKKTRSCAYCRACTGNSCLLNFKVGFYKTLDECKAELTTWDTEIIWIYSKEPCYKPMTIDESVEANKLQRKDGRLI